MNELDLHRRRIFESVAVSSRGQGGQSLKATTFGMSLLSHTPDPWGLRDPTNDRDRPYANKEGASSVLPVPDGEVLAIDMSESRPTGNPPRL